VTCLLDGNVLVALTVAEHVHHHVVSRWFAAHARTFATTPTTQGTLLRFLLRSGLDGADAWAVLDGVARHPRHGFWPDSAAYDARTLRGVVGHRQVTDSYLAARAREQAARLVTLDRGLAAAHPDVVELIDEPAMASEVPARE
jgi:uncharacterized protein